MPADSEEGLQFFLLSRQPEAVGKPYQPIIERMQLGRRPATMTADDYAVRPTVELTEECAVTT